MNNRFTSIEPHDIAWRIDQAKVDNYIEGVVPDPSIERFVLNLDQKKIFNSADRIRLISDFIKSKDESGE